jgi:UDP-glucuronate decarboxylase
VDFNHKVAKRVLVAGGAGFLGSHLCERLLSQGRHVTCLDNFYSGSRRNIEHLLGNPQFELIEHDVSAPIDIEADDIYNLAFPGSPIFYQRDPILTAKTSFLGAMNMLELACRHGARIFHASSGGVYGFPEVRPQREDYPGNVDPTGMRSCYFEGKRSAEMLCFSYARHRDVRVKVGRIFSTYGPRMRLMDGRVLSDFMGSALSGDDLIIYGNGHQTRSSCYVDDMIDAIMALMNADRSITGPQNLGNPEERSILDLARMVIRATGADVGVTHLSLPDEGDLHRQPDISRARETIGWRPSTDLEDGIERTIAWFRNSAVAGQWEPSPAQ